MEKEKDTLKLVNLRVPRDWDHRVKIVADARRTTKTSVIFLAFEREWARFKEEQAQKSLQSEM